MSTDFDGAKADAFAGRMLEILNHGAIALMTSVGHRTGLFDAMAGLPPATSAEIAEAAGLNERYVREWLGAMTTGGIVLFDPEAERFHLPREHAASLTRAATPNNIAAFAQYVPLLGAVEDGIVHCFREGGGVPYSGFPRFQEVMAEDSGQTVLPALTDAIVPLVPGLVDALRSGIDVLDVGCGSGRAMITLARAFPASRFRGIDISPDGIATARREALASGLANVRFDREDAASLAAADRYDLVTAFDAIHDQARPAEALRTIAGLLTPKGVFLMQDIAASSAVENNLDHPIGPFLYTVSCMHCMTVSLAEDGAGLGAMWGEERARAMLRDAGFSRVDMRRLPHDIQNAYYIARRV